MLAVPRIPKASSPGLQSSWLVLGAGVRPGSVRVLESISEWELHSVILHLLRQRGGSQCETWQLLPPCLQH